MELIYILIIILKTLNYLLVMENRKESSPKAFLIASDLFLIKFRTLVNNLFEARLKRQTVFDSITHRSEVFKKLWGLYNPHSHVQYIENNCRNLKYYHFYYKGW